MKPKVWCIGFHRTATRSLCIALRQLGWKCCHFELYPYFTEFDAAADMTVTLRWRQLFVDYPDAKFILTVRDMESWWTSFRRMWDEVIRKADFPEKSTLMIAEQRLIYSTIYGVSVPGGVTKHMAIRAHTQHIVDVTEFFMAEAPDQLLILGAFRGDRWEKLCRFLGVAVPDNPYPIRSDGWIDRIHPDGTLKKSKKK